MSTIFVNHADGNSLVKERKEDIDFLLHKLHAVHPAFKTNQEGMAHFYNELEAIDDHSSFSMELMRVIAKIGDSHTNVLLNETEKKLPISLVNVNNDVYILQSEDGQAKKGDKILAIGAKEIDELLDELRPYISYDHEGRFQHLVNLLTIDSILQSIGIEKDEMVELKVERNGRIITLELAYKTMETINNHDEPYRWEILSYDTVNVGYFQLIHSINDSSYQQSIASFFESVKEQRIKKVILDLRHNSGGDSTVADEWINYLDVNQYLSYRVGKVDGDRKVVVKTKNKGKYKGELYILTGPGTFSSGTMFATILKDNGLGKLIGEPAGMNSNHDGEVMIIELPHSKIKVAISQHEFVRPVLDPSGNELLNVDIPITRTIGDLMNGDGQLEKALEIITAGNE
ncbi:S41 family peptidase [Cytobacillus stercorigallinarum]|uniref:S41 family peptidase n=1 Tax=Cytobacillus stercorigallinarum TaxID=2762240 RepID=UPI001CD8BB11|nr:S41 family peptidase [Cytobacillus stercorigallinarum]